MLHALALLVISLTPWPDPFDPEFAPAVRPLRESEAVTFDRKPSRAWVEHIRSLPEESHGKQQYVAFLKETYGYSIERLNAAYGVGVSSFTELYSYDYRRLDRSRDAVRSDDDRFLALLEKAAVEAARAKR